MKQLQYYILPLIFLMMASMLSGQAERKFIRQGNKQFKDSVYDESEILYRKALEKDRESFAGEFNLGDALYKQDKYEDAARSFGNLAENETDNEKLGHLYHNIGNSLLKSQDLEGSIEAYKKALRSNPEDEETRYNLAFAQNMLQQQQEQQKQQNKDGDNQDKKDQENQDQENKQDDQQNQDQDQQQEQQQEQQPQQISKEDAERMLQALAQDEQKLQEKLKEQQARAKRVRVLKDW